MKLKETIQRFKSKLKYNINYYKLKSKIKNSKKKKVTYLKYIDSNNRAFGKTYALIKLALEHDLPILVRGRMSENHIKYLATREFNKTPKVYTIHVDGSRGMRIKTGLVEEGMNREQVTIISSICENVIGYVNFKLYSH